MFKEFKKFIMRGNMMDLAVGMIIGAAFNAIVTSLVNDILMPLLAWIIGKPDFSDLFVVLGSNGQREQTQREWLWKRFRQTNLQLAGASVGYDADRGICMLC